MRRLHKYFSLTGNKKGGERTNQSKKENNR
jgi:hypothetical protein